MNLLEQFLAARQCFNKQTIPASNHEMLMIHAASLLACLVLPWLDELGLNVGPMSGHIANHLAHHRAIKSGYEIPRMPFASVCREEGSSFPPC